MHVGINKTLSYFISPTQRRTNSMSKTFSTHGTLPLKTYTEHSFECSVYQRAINATEVDFSDKGMGGLQSTMSECGCVGITKKTFGKQNQ